MQTKGFTCYVQGSVPDAGLGWNLAFWRQTLSIVGGRRVLVKFTFQRLKFPVNFLVRRRIPQKFQALKFQNSGPEIWRLRPPPFHTPPFACLFSETSCSGRAMISHNAHGRPLPVEETLWKCNAWGTSGHEQ